jgi:hypothetical protein
MAKPVRKRRSGPSFAAKLGTNTQMGQDLQRLLDYESEILGTLPENVITTSEFKQQIENPPKEKSFPTALFTAVCALEAVDVLVLPLGITGIWTVVYNSLRLGVTGYLYYWAFTNIEGVKLVGTRRKLLKGIQQKAIGAVAANLPIPFIGAFLNILPMDAVFITLVHKQNSEAVKAIWSALGIKQKANVNITRSARKLEPDVAVDMNSGNQSERKAA